MKLVYYITMAVLAVCFASNVYCLLIVHRIQPFLKIVNIVTPVIVLFYLEYIIHRRRKIQKRKRQES